MYWKGKYYSSKYAPLYDYKYARQSKKFSEAKHNKKETESRLLAGNTWGQS